MQSNSNINPEEFAAMRLKTQKLQALYDLSPFGIALNNMDGQFLEANDSFCIITGYTESELRQLDYWQLTPLKYSKQEQAQLNSLQKSSQYGPYIKEYIHKDGHLINVRLVGLLVSDERGEKYIWSIVEDITNQVQTDEHLRLMDNVFQNVLEGICITDAEENIVKVNQFFCDLTGYTQQQAIGKTPRILASGKHSADFYQKMWQAIHKYDHWRGELWNRRPDGELYAVRLTISALRDESGKVSHHVGLLMDITRQKEQAVHMERLAHYDALTQIPNRVLLADRMKQAIAQNQRHSTILAVCFLDLDGFKPINDHWGHETGDQVLIKMAQRLKDSLRVGDTIARLGGDEFALLLPDFHSESECAETLDRILETINQPIKVQHQMLTLSASIGVCLYRSGAIEADTLLRDADYAMYQAKQSGRNRYIIYDTEKDQSNQQLQLFYKEIEQALLNDEFVVYYQPRVNMRLGIVTGAEALVRWRHPSRGLLAPNDFLPILEDTDYIVRLGRVVLQKVVEQLEYWHQHDLPLRLSANIAAYHLQHADFYSELEILLKKYNKVNPYWLELEILETAGLEDMQGVSEVIQNCQSLGVGFALDDFGTGYSSLTYLRHLPANTIKIDRTFVKEMLWDSDDMAIVESVVSLAEAFHRMVVAEGVETIEHGLFLINLGCEEGQGYGIARPMPAEELLEWSHNWKADPTWLSATPHRWSRDDLSLLIAENEHHKWISNLMRFLEDPAGQLEPVHDIDNCRFGSWYNGIGETRYGEHVIFQELGEIHKEVHTTGNQIFSFIENNDYQQARNLGKTLLKLKKMLSGKLHELLQLAAHQ